FHGASPRVQQRPREELKPQRWSTAPAPSSWRSSGGQRQIGVSWEQTRRLSRAEQSEVGMAARRLSGLDPAITTSPPRLSVSISAKPRVCLVSCEVTLHRHRSAASALHFAPSGAILTSDKKDLLDVIAHAGLFRPRGHRDQVIDFVFLDSGKKLVTCSKDKVIWVWDLDT
ncbi:hypothetical protein CFC21_016404, partial [Triticum aestivum]|uniref:Uncharacterized protein n=3 Tax=Triticum TaxID=4564 RepID=A0A3B6AWK0_WHEAT